RNFWRDAGSQIADPDFGLGTVAGAGAEMKPGRAFSLLTGVALLGGIARFNEMTPDAQAAFLSAATETARTTAQSLLSSAVETYNDRRAPAAPQPARGAPVTTRPATTVEAPRKAAAPRPADASAEAPPTGNPLWALPLKQLSMTRERPVFSPSRRPPPPPAPAYV